MKKTIVLVGSTNEDKLAIVKDFYKEIDFEVVVEGKKIESGVSVQPFGLEEVLEGAENRAKKVLCEASELIVTSCDQYLGLGLEAGMVKVNGLLFYFGVAAFFDGKNFSCGISEMLPIPSEVADLVLKGESLGEQIRVYVKKLREDDSSLPLINNIINRKEIFTTALYSAWMTLKSCK